MGDKDNVIDIMQGLQYAAQSQGWCLVEGPAGCGKTPSVRAALQQLGWESAWKGPDDLENDVDAFYGAPAETLVFDGLVDEWAPTARHQTPETGWTRLYIAITVAMERAKRGLLTVLCTTCREDAEHIDREELPGCVSISLG